MTIYIPLLYICLGVQCEFFQSESYTLDEKKCEQEIIQQKTELIKQGKTVEAICVDVDIKLERQINELERKLYPQRTNQV
jgi:3-phosphoglycerate kinase